MTDFNYYDYGDLVVVSGAFVDANAAAVDPDAVLLDVRTPDGVLVTYTYGVDAIIVKDSVGNYHANLDVEQAGQWFYRWYSTGNGQAAVLNYFQVNDPI